MSDLSRLLTDLPQEQRFIRTKCFHPSGLFVEFRKAEIEQSIPSRFEQQVARDPDRIAVKTRSQTLTYDELNRAANRVACAILAQRGDEEEPAALLLDHDATLIVGILGVLKAGKSCVPLDSSYPRARISYLLEDTQAGLIVTNNENLSLAKEFVNNMLHHVINIDDIDASLFTENPGPSPDTLAWILYTSGSTGQPKGVVQNHRNTLNEIRRHTNAFHISADDRMSFVLPCSVIGGMREILLALLNGASLYPLNLKEEGLAKLVNWLIDERISVCRFVSTVFRSFVGTLTGEEDIATLRLIYVGGEPVTKRDVELYKKHFSSDCIFVNVLGATETGIFRHYFVTKETQITGNIVPVGYAVEDMQVLLLGDAGRQPGVNEVGEIAVKSRYLAPGYWKNEELTRTVFLPDPKGGMERIYLTGDLGLMRSDGCLEYIGRKDFQVKISGYRIEVSEIEMALLDLVGIKKAVVLAREDPPGYQRLVAYIVPVQGRAPAIPDLRRFLKAKLPEYMVPSTFVFLDALPLTPNGKVDRRALPALDQGRPEVETTFVAPQNALEVHLSRIWEKVLGIEPIGVRDNFFELGGHSLLAMGVLAQIEKQFGKNLPLAILFQAPTVEQLASILRQKGRSTSPSLVIPLQPLGSKPPFFCHGASLDMALHVDTDQPFYGLQPHGQDGRQAPSTIEEMAADYLKEIRTIQPEGPYFLGGYSFGGIVAFEMAQQLQKQGQKVALLVLIDPASPSSDLAVNTSFGYEIYQHLSNLVRLGNREKLTYVLERVKWRLDEINRKIKMMVCRFYLGIDRRVPFNLRMFYFFEASRHATQEYVPQIYPGRIIFLKAEKSSLEWHRLAAEGLETHEVPGRHLELLRAPHAQVLGENLRSCFEQAQATCASFTFSLRKRTEEADSER